MAKMLKVAFGGVTVVCAILALGLAAGGIWYTVELNKITSMREIAYFQLNTTIHWSEILPYIFAVVGSLGLIITLCGLYGVAAYDRHCLIGYIICAVIIIISMIASGTMAMLLGDESTEGGYLKQNFQSAFNNAKEYPEIRARFSNMETALYCCGVDKTNIDYPLNAKPPSCCDNGDCTKGINKRNGCYRVFQHLTNQVFYIGTIGSALVAFMACISLILSAVLVRKTPKETEDVIIRPSGETHA